jgi:hypothetical protein
VRCGLPTDFNQSSQTIDRQAIFDWRRRFEFPAIEYLFQINEKAKINLHFPPRRAIFPGSQLDSRPVLRRSEAHANGRTAERKNRG